MNFLTSAVMLALMAAAVPGAAKGPKFAPTEPLENVLTLQVDGTIKIDEAGAVSSFQTLAPISPELREQVDRVVLGWRFKPIVVDGQARPASSTIRIVLAAAKNSLPSQGVRADKDAAYRVTVDNVVFPNANKLSLPSPAVPAPISGKSMRPPEYPPGLLQHGVTGMVLLGIRVGADGKTAQVHAVQSMLFDIRGQERALREAIAILENSAIDAAKHWTYNVDPKRPDADTDMTVTVPVEYRIGRAEPDVTRTWRTVVRLARHAIPWLPRNPDQQEVGVADATAGEIIPAESEFKFVAPVNGTVVM